MMRPLQTSRSIGLFLLGTGALTWVPSAAAQSSPEAQAKAQALFEEGRKKACPEAIPFFERSLALFEGRGALLNLASCQEKVGRLVDAAATYHRLLPRLDEGDDRMPIVRKALELLSKRIALLTVSPPESVLGARAWFDDSPATWLPLPLQRGVDPNREIVLQVDMGDGTPREYRLTLKEGEERRLAVGADSRAAKGEETATSESSAADTTSPLLSRTAGWIGVGIGSAALVGALVAGGMALEQKSALEEECPVPARCSEEGKDMARNGQTLTDVGTGLAIGGAVLVGAGLVVVVLSGPKGTSISLGPREAHVSGSF